LTRGEGAERGKVVLVGAAPDPDGGRGKDVGADVDEGGESDGFYSDGMMVI